MRSRTIREGSVGLLILLGLGLFAGLILWIRGISLGSRSYKVVLEFSSIAGMQVGTPVRFRGVPVGKIVQTRPGPNGVEVEIEISPNDLIIPKDVIVEANQSGLLGDSSIDITPKKDLSVAVTAKPLDPKCDSSVIVCNNSRLPGRVGVSVDELIRSSIRFTTAFSDEKLLSNVNTLTKNSAEAALEISKLSREFGALARVSRQELVTFSGSARAVTQAANQLGLTAAQVNELLVTNRATLVATLNNINGLTAQLRTTVNGLNPVVNRIQQGELLRNLETLSANAAQASANFRDLSQALNTPSNLLTIQQTLDSARATFQNVQKITSDLDDLTGDPKFRNNLKNLVNGLSGLVSSTQELQQQARLAQLLESASAAHNNPAAPVPAPAPVADLPKSLPEALPATHPSNEAAEKPAASKE